jgi:DNA-binding CsgD family transcriptional regulator
VSAEPVVEVIERGDELDDIRSAMDDVLDGSGRARAITGDPGAGKSTLIDAVCTHAPGMRILRGLCDALSTPRPLGPLRDIAAELGRPLTRLGESSTAFAELCDDLYRDVGAERTILVVEDAQWSDEASIDVLRFLLRRLEAIPVLLLVSYRDSGIDPGHPLRPLLGDLARLPYASTIPLAPLSVEAVGDMVAGTGLDPVSVRDLTGGNAFYVTEVARHGHTGLPPSVRDVVLANASGLDPADFDTLQMLAAAPDGLDDRLLPVLEIDLPQLRRLDATGLLVRTRRGVAFRHELARLAVESSIPAGGAAQLHARILDGLQRLGSDDHAAMTHHAVEAHDPDRISRYARRAADEAVRAGSHTEAVAFLHLAIEHHRGTPAERARLFQQLAAERYMINRLPAAIDAAAEARRLWREAGDPIGEAGALDQWATYEYYSGRQDAAEVRSDRAAQVANDAAATLSYGHARATRAYLAIRHGDHDLTMTCQREALAAAEELDDEVLRTRTEIIDRVAAVARGEVAARGELLDLVDHARSRSLDEIASMGMSNLVSSDVEQCRLHDADELLARSLPFTVEREIKICNVWQRGVRARLHLLRGRWEAALEDARELVDEEVPPLARLTPHLVIGSIEMRRHGRDDGHLETAWELAELMDDPIARLAVVAALTERAWLGTAGDERVRAAHGWIGRERLAPGLGWSAGRLAVWLGRTGFHVERSDGIEPPFRCSLLGDHADAARRWREVGDPFEAAMADLDSDDVDRQAGAIAMLDGMGAAATADRWRSELRGRGITSLPTRPRASTRANPAGLTNRQLEVARLLTEGLTNTELAERLYISSKTADHHVSAVLSKLGLSSRREIAALVDVLG